MFTFHADEFRIYTGYFVFYTDEFGILTTTSYFRLMSTELTLLSSQFTSIGLGFTLIIYYMICNVPFHKFLVQLEKSLKKSERNLETIPL